MAWAEIALDALWRDSWVVIPLALLVACVTRWIRCRPATRHALWVVVLLWFIAPLAPLPQSPLAVDATAVVALDSEPLKPTFRTPETLFDHTASRDPDTERDHPRSRRESESTTFAQNRAKRSPPLATWGEAGNSARRTSQKMTGSTANRRLDDGERETEATSPHRVARSETRAPHWLPPARGSDEHALRRASQQDDTPRVARTGSQARPVQSVAGRTAKPEAARLEAITNRPPAATRRVTHLEQRPQRQATQATAKSIDTSEETAAAAPEPAAPVKPTPDEPPEHRGRSAWRAWAAGLSALREALGRLPAFPVRVWILGLVLLAILHALRVAWFVSRMRRAIPAPQWVRREVALISKRFGLRRVPETVILDDSLSPLVWCGRRVRLVLPWRLWCGLDRAGRRAILCHELAHLKRRDHWVRWIQMVVSLVYWWHPLAWWVRRRIEDEADLACDAWVTWVMPQGRRAYAEALLRTQTYAGGSRWSAPGTAMSVLTSGARRLSRRLTMVMTQRVRPRPSLVGSVLVCGVMLAGWAAAPAFSCPPEKDKAQAKPLPPATLLEPAPAMPAEPAVPPGPAIGARSASSAVMSVAPMPAAPPAAVAPMPVAPLTAQSSVLLLGQDEQSEDDLAQRLAELEEQLDRLRAHLRDLSRDLQRGERRERRRSVGVGPQEREIAPRGPRTLFRSGGEQIARTYRLPEGKLDALTELMIRPDVPIRVRPLEDGLEVHATAAQQEAFAGFVGMIEGEWVWRSYELPEGKLDALVELMARNDVPVLIRPEGDAIGVRATPAQHEMFQAFVELIQPGAEVRPSEQEHAEQERQEVEEQIEHGARRIQRQIESAQRTHAEALHEAAQAQAHVEQQMHAFAAQTAGLQAQADSFRDQAAALQERAEAAFEHAEQERSALREQAFELRRRAREFERRARELERGSKRIKQEADHLKEELDSSDARADDVECPQIALHRFVQSAASEGKAPWKSISGTIQDLAQEQPAIAHALRQAAHAVRTEGTPEARHALEQAAEALRAQGGQAVADALTHVDESLADHGRPIADHALSRLAEMLKTDAADGVAGTLEQIAQALEGLAEPADSDCDESGPDNSERE